MVSMLYKTSVCGGGGDGSNKLLECNKWKEATKERVFYD